MYDDQILHDFRLKIPGGGQLGMFTAKAALKAGLDPEIWAEHHDAPGTYVAKRLLIAPFTDAGAAREFLRDADVITPEFENIPPELLEKLAPKLSPSANVIKIAQNREREKFFLASSGRPIAPYRTVNKRIDAWGRKFHNFRFPAILKTSMWGYDGKNQIAVLNPHKVMLSWEKLGRVPCVIESKVAFQCEFSIIGARRKGGQTACYPAIENEHRGGILSKSTWPNRLTGTDTERRAQEMAVKIATDLDVVGLLTVEFFLTNDGEILVNELAPRPHNSGHGTMDACEVSQYDQLIRAVRDMELGPTTPHSGWVMTNLIGVSEPQILDEGELLYWYRKSEVREGRKMGHVTKLFPL